MFFCACTTLSANVSTSPREIGEAITFAFAFKNVAAMRQRVRVGSRPHSKRCPPIGTRHIRPEFSIGKFLVVIMLLCS